MILILLCYFTVQHENPCVRMSAQLFNIGVPIFFILSGFLFGVHHTGIQSWTGWYLKRVKRIYIPFEIFVAVLALTYVALGRSIFTTDWLLLALGMQGTVVGVQGAEQTWFISALLICYLVTPLISIVTSKEDNKKIMGVLAFAVGASVVLSFVRAPSMFTLFTPIIIYAIGFWGGANAEKIPLKKKYIPYLILLMFGSFGIRIAARALWDGTILYDRIVVFYTQMIGALSICYVISSLFKEAKENRAVKWIGKISFEIYLFHYMFTVGPVSLFGATPTWLTDCLLVLIVTIGIAWLSHCFADRIVATLDGTNLSHGR